MSIKDAGETLSKWWNHIPSWLPVLVIVAGGISTFGYAMAQFDNTKQKVHALEQEARDDRDAFEGFKEDQARSIADLNKTATETKTDVAWIKRFLERTQ